MIFKFTFIYLFLASNIFALETSGIEYIEVHPIFKEYYSCGEHPVGQFTPNPEDALGDALGADCTVKKFTTTDGRQFGKLYENNGYNNEDWHSWGKSVLSPIDGVVQKIHKNPITNSPGIRGQGPASFVKIQREGRIIIILAHLKDILVEVGQSVRFGDEIAKAGNDGAASAPHVHIGAYKGKTPLQIRFNLKAMGKLRGY